MRRRSVVWLLLLVALFAGWLVYDRRQVVPEGTVASDQPAPASDTSANPDAAAAPTPPPGPLAARDSAPERGEDTSHAETTPAIAPAPPAAVSGRDSVASVEQGAVPARVAAGEAEASAGQSAASARRMLPPAPSDRPDETEPAGQVVESIQPQVRSEETVAGSPEPAASDPGTETTVDWQHLAKIAPEAAPADAPATSPADEESGEAEIPAGVGALVQALVEQDPPPPRPPGAALERDAEQREAALEVAPAKPGAVTGEGNPSPAGSAMEQAAAPSAPGPDQAAGEVLAAPEEPHRSLSFESIRQALAALLGRTPEAPEPAVSATTGAEPQTEAEQTESANPDEPVRPSFDIVRVERDGRAVVAGRAAPGAEVELRAGERVLDRVRASRRGEWVATPAEPLAPGGEELTLAARSGDGASEVRSDQVVVVAVPEPPPPQPAAVAVGEPPPPQPAELAEKVAPAEPVAVLLPDDSTAKGRILQAPGRISGDGKLALLVLDYDHAGQVRLTGEGPPGAPVRVYVDNQPSAEVVVPSSGEWSTVLERELNPGDYTLRLDQLGTGGRPVARLETPFTRVERPPVAGRAQVDYVIVQPGNSLWRIARRLFGDGFKYVHIYDANDAQIRDPDLIYPGQVFEVPAALGAAG